ncbi:MAG TPA: hypothetical protein VFR04_02190, partial [Solirubrobacterales bacterium]|nr:hypothetical protein [Solirubrobacterales bacterium]
MTEQQGGPVPVAATLDLIQACSCERGCNLIELARKQSGAGERGGSRERGRRSLPAVAPPTP